MTIDSRLPPLNELISLKGKTALVTGGASGIGLAIAYRLAEAGALVCLTDANPEALHTAQVEFDTRGYTVSTLLCDISQEAAVISMMEAAASAMKRIDILVNNAGIYPQIALESMTATDFDRIISVNLKGTFLCSREAARHMMAQQSGTIINIASIDALHPSYRKHSAYDASKGAVVSFTRSLALELGQYNIRVNAIAPGGIITGGIFSQLSGSRLSQDRKVLKEFMARMAMGRMGRPDEVARVALFLASDMASYMTGSLVLVDGGYLVG